MQCEVIAPKRAGIDVKLANGKHISVAPGQRVPYDLTGDEVGAVLGHIADKLRAPDEVVVDPEAFMRLQRREHGDAAGGVLCAERDTPPAEGSKAWRALAAAGKIKVTRKQVQEYGLDAALAPPEPAASSRK